VTWRTSSSRTSTTSRGRPSASRSATSSRSARCSARATWPVSRRVLATRSGPSSTAAYEVYPKGHKFAGRRRFKRCRMVCPEGAGEDRAAGLDRLRRAPPRGPVRCDGFDAHGEPVGRPVSSRTSRCWPTTRTRSRSSRTACCRTCASEGPDADLFDISLERIIRPRRPRHRRRQGRPPGAVTERARRCAYDVPGVRRAAPHVPAAAARGAPDDEQQPAEAAGRRRVVAVRRHRRRARAEVDRESRSTKRPRRCGTSPAGTRGSSTSTATPAPCTRARRTGSGTTC
jgi:hypothetical protein